MLPEKFRARSARRNKAGQRFPSGPARRSGWCLLADRGLGLVGSILGRIGSLAHHLLAGLLGRLDSFLGRLDSVLTGFLGRRYSFLTGFLGRVSGCANGCFSLL